MATATEAEDESRDLVVQLLTRAGMIMEDASAVAVLSGQDGTSLSNIIRELERSAEAIASLIGAAKMLLVVGSTGGSAGQR